MSNVTRLLFYGVSCLLFALSAAHFMRTENLVQLHMASRIQPQVAAENGAFTGDSNLNQISGEQVIGMVPFALAGDYPLTIDGIPISTTTDPTTIDFSSVPGLTYTLSVTRDADRNLTKVVATHQ